MLWTALADSVLFLHALWVLAVLLGPLWCWRRPRWRWAHLGMMALVVVFALTLGHCPVTDLENALWRRAAPERVYRGTFFVHYVLDHIVYWDHPAWLLTAACAGWGILWAAVYARLWRREARQGT